MLLYEAIVVGLILLCVLVAECGPPGDSAELAHVSNAPTNDTATRPTPHSSSCPQTTEQVPVTCSSLQRPEKSARLESGPGPAKTPLLDPYNHWPV